MATTSVPAPAPSPAPAAATGGAGGSTPGVPDDWPAWAKTLLSRPMIEVRRGLSFGYDPPTEKSSVIALTAPSGKNVDIRFSMAADSFSATAPWASSLFDGYATAGVARATLPIGTESCVPYECCAHVTWEHTIDSSCQFDTDGADMYLLGNGDVMEIGTMADKEGKVKMFKEYWTKPDPDAKVRPCVVAEAEGLRGEKGMIIRIGEYCQGIYQGGESFWAERWQLSQDDNIWQKHEKSKSSPEGSEYLPCLWLVEDGRKLDDVVDVSGGKWRITEAVY
ncbi:hypothetical protein UCRPA7_1715 [Phaeoacremonium minimum UCRPA7]|uniref:Protein HRI1 n=1 Tax=Phaeoacremonium minimum (strain UCR-PA7) TaxID=1286976 RepID=R8BTX8_PHAM7|nr:hypothetical protein UCRPA7_1715 [Phaeoacremonium minimum UCRPA7]EOO02749.1 hypothetical protein UCRPA7_1715 [Phaeoacremonium minimum UCRPA7]